MSRSRRSPSRACSSAHRPHLRMCHLRRHQGTPGPREAEGRRGDRWQRRCLARMGRAGRLREYRSQQPHHRVRRPEGAGRIVMQGLASPVGRWIPSGCSPSLPARAPGQTHKHHRPCRAWARHRRGCSGSTSSNPCCRRSQDRSDLRAARTRRGATCSVFMGTVGLFLGSRGWG